MTYSATTSAKHQSQLYKLSGETIPADASLEEYMRVLNGQMRFVRDGKCLRTVAA